MVVGILIQREDSEAITRIGAKIAYRETRKDSQIAHCPWNNIMGEVYVFGDFYFEKQERNMLNNKTSN